MEIIEEAPSTPTSPPKSPRRKAQPPSSSGRKKQFAVSTKWEAEAAANGGTTRDFHRFFCCCAERLGNMFVFCKRPDGSPIVIAGPCWPFCCFVTVPLILGACGAVSYWLIIRENSALPLWVSYIYFPVLGFVLAALFGVSCTDPGLMERVTDEEAGEGGW
eukprot:CAMPEP_0113652456 /NCGR_PEP_ID=MMETSP0017_2-20120614/28022_1 /TAXON_ID=2856 /ORGANISM="Cylindrotheca closterium" /LENGTH=160 /DNA_ID=CAMNT_0000565317 /DNA_START=297 /DNA_END=776 /DNA_ORIENTATION=- /assembly_acc=CAM_ASM_000147